MVLDRIDKTNVDYNRCRSPYLGGFVPLLRILNSATGDGRALAMVRCGKKVSVGVKSDE